MTLYNTQELLSVANQKGGFAVGAFNVHNMEYTQGVIKAAEMENAPVILMIGEAMIPYCGLDMIAAICQQAAQSTRVPVAIALDHGKKMENINSCLELGISVMFDGSHYPFEENIRLTAEVCQKAHQLGLPVEGELGNIGGSEEGEDVTPEMMTNPDAAEDYVNRTGVDILAIAIGNIHGLYKKPPHLDIERLKAIRRKVSIPVVLHGGSDLPIEMSCEVIKEGISKFNIGTDLKYAFSRRLKEALNAEPMPFQPPHVMGPARDAVCEVARKKIQIFGSTGTASLYSKS
jgi:ketose-bisphosphate aldolase